MTDFLAWFGGLTAQESWGLAAAVFGLAVAVTAAIAATGKPVGGNPKHAHRWWNWAQTPKQADRWKLATLVLGLLAAVCVLAALAVSL